MPRSGRGASVCILLATYNGGLYLREQLESIRRQTYKNWRIVVSDDGSSDETLQILRDFQSSLPGGRVFVMDGPRRGYVENFLHLMRSHRADSDLYAFCDQDDIWDDNKVERAVVALGTVPLGVPAAYATRTRLIGENGAYIGLSPRLRRPPDFRNALVQNVVHGNTLVFNDEMRSILRAMGAISAVSHDWLVYLVATAIGAAFLFEDRPSISYRQHGRNLIGGQSTIKGCFRRFGSIGKGRYRAWMKSNLCALKTVRGLMSPENQLVLERFCRARKSWGGARLYFLARSGVRRQTWWENVALTGLVLLNRA